MTIKFHHPRPWDVIEKYASRQKAYVAVPFIGKSAAKLLPIPQGSVLVTRFSQTAVRAGQVDPRELLKFIKRGVSVHAHDQLHAKVYAFGNRCFIGSANVSESSRGLVEACVETTDPATVKQARKFVEDLTSDLLTEKYVKSLVPLYPADGERLFGTRSSQVRRGQSKVDRLRVWISPAYEQAWSDAVVAKDRIVSKVAERQISAPETRKLDKLNCDKKPGFKVGDWLITRYGSNSKNYEFTVPGRVIMIEPVSRKEGYLVYCEQPKKLQGKDAATVTSLLGELASQVMYRGNQDRFIRRNETAQSVLRMWKAFRAE